MGSLDSKIKEANFLGAGLGKLNKVVNEGFLGNTVNNYGLVRDIGYSLGWKNIKKYNVMGLSKPMGKVEDLVKDKFNALPKNYQNGLKKLDKGMDFAFNKVQMPVMLADMGLNMTGLGGSKQIDAMQKQTAIMKGIQKANQPPKHIGNLGDMFKEGSMGDIYDTKEFERQRKINLINARCNALENDLREIKKHLNDELNLREPSVFEKPWLIDICKQLADIFLISTKRDEELIKDRIYSQDTLISGSMDNLNGFINFGDRSFKNNGPKVKYIRVVYVNPDKRGSGIAAKLIDSVTHLHEPVWMQISHTNNPMKKTASKMGFSHFDTWKYDGHTSELWGRNIPNEKSASVSSCDFKNSMH